MRALIIGIDSAIGQGLAVALGARGDRVVGTTRRPVAPDEDGRVFLDLALPDAAETPLPPVDIAVFCAAKARYAECRADPAEARRVNVEMTLRLAHRLAAEGGRVLLLSTSAVFDGSRPHRRAVDPTGAASLYGRLKAEAEAGFLGLGAGAAILRLTKLVTRETPLFAEWLAALGAGRKVRAFADLRFCPLALSDVVGALVAAIDDRGDGVYQVSGSNDIGYADAARHLALRLDRTPGLVERVSAVDHGIPPEETLAHTSLDTQRLSALTGFRPPAPTEVLDTVFALSPVRPMEPAG